MKTVDILNDALSMAQHNLNRYGGRVPKPEHAEEWQWQKEVGKLLEQMIAVDEEEKTEVYQLSISVVNVPELKFNNGDIKWYPDKVKAVGHGN